MAKTLPISEVKTHLPELVSKVEDRDEQIVVTRNGKPAAVILSYGEYERLRDTLDVLSDPAMMRQIHRSVAYFARGGKGRSFEDVFGEPLLRG
ncbi:MAG: type II toxin-antitoxin system Phd/YefM family antitoxin [Candidatus Omnitrophica bacterium]|nr:type II toxin-antitoxin system Phd/YefM family antitoxin [Candidatus Omnitrophota bacterium]